MRSQKLHVTVYYNNIITNVVSTLSYLTHTFESSCDIFASVSRSEAANNSLNR